MRLAGTINFKTGRYARIVHADFQMTPYSPEALVGDLPDPPWAMPARARADPRPSARARIRTSGSRRRCISRRSPASPSRAAAWSAARHRGMPTRQPSCSVSTDPERGWCCHGGSCLARGAIYDLASVLLGGPWGHQLRGEHFRNARAYVADVFGELT